MSTLGKFVLLLGLASVVLPTGAQNLGTIKGSVVSDGNRPAAGAEVCLEKHQVFPAEHGLLCKVRTEADAAGNFRFEGLEGGTYTVSASKCENGYGGMLLEPYFHKGPPPTVTLSPASRTSAVVKLDLGSQAGVLLIAWPTDAITGKQIPAPAIILWRLDDPKPTPLDSLTNGGYDPRVVAPWPGCCPADPSARKLVPSNTDIGFVILAAGYKPWPSLAMPVSRRPDYTDVWQNIPLHPPSKEGVLHLAPGEIYKLIVKMEPVAE